MKNETDLVKIAFNVTKQQKKDVKKALLEIDETITSFFNKCIREKLNIN